MIIVAASGNTGSEFINSELDDGSTIMVGSHNNKGLISRFSAGKCRVNVCSLGEDVFMKHVEPNVRSGTSFAAAHVTAVVTNLLSSLHTFPNENTLRGHFKDTAGFVYCQCIRHHGDTIALKLTPRRMCLTHTTEMNRCMV